ncbi:radical SAM family heme chaperone HemW [Oceanibacterium hippocampi]|uniref:Heme chaperone HemW n=1 Tax=Oceanibacterium hippocampi TaxID=745714 RepID=A0A1Y5RI00_9PROT|nr:radical SAM family heme chaperone HemW [Oceanibacterium hippocampi]SLN18043.1 Oxygen-independent coproporphyrinogen-III oxidase 1 [Oceanibacterium hippocampi]
MPVSPDRTTGTDHPAVAPDRGFGIYVHWPFCLKKCPYCDFNSHVRAAHDPERFAEGYAAEIRYWAGRLPRRPVDSIFFGGGTPSLMPVDLVAAVIEGIATTFGLADDVEITLEANPTSVEAAKFEGFRAAGVNRLSLGVQSLDGATLGFLGREHSASEALAALDLAQAVFPRGSFDLIYAHPGQTPAAWERELAAALERSLGHLSLYQLTLEPGTAFHSAARQGRLVLPPDETTEALFRMTREMTAAAGLPAYETSNHARPGEESRHNLIYWRSGDYLGLGPGAHGRIAIDGIRRATAAHRKPERWLDAVGRAGHGVEVETPLTEPQELAEEVLLMGLRLREGVWKANFEAVVGRPIAAMTAASRLARLVEHGLLGETADRLYATEAGHAVLNSVVAELCAD